MTRRSSGILVKLLKLDSKLPLIRRSRANLPNLPQELYGLVFRFVENRRDVLSLCLVSRAVCHEADRILYESVDLSFCHCRIYFWFTMIASRTSRTQHLAAAVRSLTFGLDHSPLAPPYSLLEAINHGLMSLINLKE